MVLHRSVSKGEKRNGSFWHVFCLGYVIDSSSESSVDSSQNGRSTRHEEDNGHAQPGEQKKPEGQDQPEGRILDQSDVASVAWRLVDRGTPSHSSIPSRRSTRHEEDN